MAVHAPMTPTQALSRALVPPQVAAPEPQSGLAAAQSSGLQLGAAASLATALTAAHAGQTNRALQAREAFHIGGLPLMIRYEHGSELTDLPAVHQVPNAPDWFMGMTNLHGALLPVFDLAGYLGLQAPRQRKPLMLVLGHGAQAAGVLVDDLPRRLRFDEPQRLADAPVPAGLEGCVTGAA